MVSGVNNQKVDTYKAQSTSQTKRATNSKRSNVPVGQPRTTTAKKASNVTSKTFSVELIQTKTKGKFKSWEGYVDAILNNAGVELDANAKALLVATIKTLNGNKDISQLDQIIFLATPDYANIALKRSDVKPAPKRDNTTPTATNSSSVPTTKNGEKFEVQLVQTGMKGKYKSYDDYARAIVKYSGVQMDNAEIKKLADKIKELNNNKDIKNLDEIKFLATPKYAQRCRTYSDVITPQVQQNVNKFSVPGNQNIAKGAYKSYEEYCKKLVENAEEHLDQASFNALVKKIKKMNDNKPIGELTNIKFVTTTSHAHKINFTDQKFSVQLIQTHTKGLYSSWDKYCESLVKNAGEHLDQASFNSLVARVRKLNGDKPINELSEIKYLATPAYAQKQRNWYVSKFSVQETQYNTLGKYKSYEEYVQKLVYNAEEHLDQTSFNALVSKIKDLNGGQDISKLSSIKFLATPQYSKTWHAKSEAAKYSVIVTQPNTKGKYSSWDKYCESLVKNAGVELSPEAYNQLVIKIKKLNGNKPIKDLSEIKFYAPPAYAHKSEAFFGANELYSSMKGIGTDRGKFDKIIASVTPDNAADMVLRFHDILSNGEGLLEMMGNEVEFDWTKHEWRVMIIKPLIEALVTKAESLGLGDDLDVRHLNIKDGTQYLDYKLSDNEVDVLMMAVARKIKAYENPNFKNTNISKTDVLKDLNSICPNADNILKDIKNSDGIFGKFDEILRENGVYGVVKDANQLKYKITCFNNNIKRLEAAAKKGDVEFKTEFKTIFGVEYNPVLIKQYNAMRPNIENAMAVQSLISSFESGKTGELLRNNATVDNIASYESALAKYLGGGDISRGDIIIKGYYAKKGADVGTIGGGPSREVLKLQALKELADMYENSLDVELKKYTGGMTYKAYCNKAKSTFKAAYGESHVALAAEDYRIAHGATTGAMKGVIKGVVTTVATIYGGPLGGAVAAFSSGTGVEVTDALTRKKPLQDGEITKILKDAAVDGAMVYIGGRVLQNLSNLSNFKKLEAEILTDTITDSMGNIFKEGRITVDGIVISVIFNSAGKAVKINIPNGHRLTQAAIDQLGKTPGQVTNA